MALFGRRPPAQARAIAGAQRLLAFAAVEQTYLVATVEGLWWPDEPRRLIPWSSISKASWGDGVLSVVEADTVADLLLVDRPPVRIRLVEPGLIPSVVRDRVERSIRSRDLVNTSYGPARLVARRVPGVDGLVWRARLEAGTPDSELLRAQLRVLVQAHQAASDEARQL